MPAEDRPALDTPEYWAEVKAALERAREPYAPGPGPSAGELAEAYLGVLKLALCDLAAPRTMSVERTPRGIASHELWGGELRKRSLGSDWPRYGLSMAGLARLDDLQECVRTVVADGVAGELIETGTWRGGASMLMRATLDTLGDDRTVWVADSFTGFREDLRSEDLAAVDFLAVPLEEVQANFARFGLDTGVEFLPGYFEQTMPAMAGREWAICRLDGDSYEATRVCLETLYPGLAAGGYLIVDDYYVLDECRAAVDEFRAEHGIEEPLEQVDWTCTRWRRETAPPPRPPGAATDPPATPPAHSDVERPPYTPVPTAEELALRERLEAAEAELERLRRSPVARLSAWRTR
jgi:O-methyltransferase